MGDRSIFRFGRKMFVRPSSKYFDDEDDDDDDDWKTTSSPRSVFRSFVRSFFTIFQARWSQEKLERMNGKPKHTIIILVLFQLIYNYLWNMASLEESVFHHRSFDFMAFRELKVPVFFINLFSLSLTVPGDHSTDVSDHQLIRELPKKSFSRVLFQWIKSIREKSEKRKEKKNVLYDFFRFGWFDWIFSLISRWMKQLFATVKNKRLIKIRTKKRQCLWKIVNHQPIRFYWLMNKNYQQIFVIFLLNNFYACFYGNSISVRSFNLDQSTIDHANLVVFILISRISFLVDLFWYRSHGDVLSHG